MTKPMKLKGEVTISRWTSNVEPHNGVTIRITDEASLSQFVELRMSVEEFGNAVTGLSSRPCEIEVRGLDKLGLTRQNTTELVWVPNSLPYNWIENETLVRRIVEIHEVNGWRLQNTSDLRNSHKSSKAEDKLWDGAVVPGRYYSASFVRWIDLRDPETTPRTWEKLPTPRPKIGGPVTQAITEGE